MKTDYAIMIDRCGLSIEAASRFSNVRLDTSKSWSSGRNGCPIGVMDELRELYHRMENAAEQACLAIEESVENNDSLEEIEIGLAADDHEAQGLGWPSVGVHQAVVGLVIAQFPGVKFKIVPRGSTVATAAAIEIHGR